MADRFAFLTPEQKAAAFDEMATALTNCWHDGKWSWWCCSPCGGDKHESREEAVKELVEWAERVAARDVKRNAPLKVTT
jgi:hypothetical protein